MEKVLQDLSSELSAVAQTAGESIVRVEGRRRIPASGTIWSADGVIVTANHTLRRDDNIRIGLPDGSTTTASIAGRDSATDIAVLRSDASGLTAANWANITDLSVGNLVLALGRPGKTVQATLGIVSALGKEWRTHAGGQIDNYLQTDVVMYPGFSGGPLVGAGGQAIGLNSSALMRGVSVTIPAGTLESIVAALLEKGRVPRGYLGITVQPVRLPEAAANAVDQETGILLTSVEADSPAGKGGLVLGDTIVGLDGEPVRDHEDLLSLLASGRTGKSVEVQIVRGGEQQKVTVEVGERE